MSEITRTEKFLRACIDGEPCALKPLTRVEKLLAELNDKLAGGASEVVILPETEVAAISESPITTAPNAMPEVGAVCTVTYNGTAYDCPAVAAAITAEVTGVAFGNTDALGIPGGNTNAPFMVVLLETPMDMEGVPVYGMLLPQGGTAEGTYVTISIVEKAETASAGGGGVLVINMSCDLSDDMSTVTNPTKDKTFAEAKAVYDAGGIVVVRLECKSGPMAGCKFDFERTAFMVMGGQSGFMFAMNNAAGPNMINLLSDDSFNIMID